MFIVVVGNIADGLEFYGPFEDADSASDFAEKNRLEEWIAIKLIMI